MNKDQFVYLEFCAFEGLTENEGPENDEPHRRACKVYAAI